MFFKNKEYCDGNDGDAASDADSRDNYGLSSLYVVI